MFLIPRLSIDARFQRAALEWNVSLGLRFASPQALLDRAASPLQVFERLETWLAEVLALPIFSCLSAAKMGVSNPRA